MTTLSRERLNVSREENTMMISNGRRILKPRDIERILNYNGFYPERQNGGYVLFKDDIGREISIRRGKIDTFTWNNIAKENELVEPERAFR